MSDTTVTKRKQKVNVRYLTGTAMLSAISVILMYLEFSIPMIIPPFVKFGFSELPALIGSFAYGPVCGVLICLIKNLLHLTVSNSMLVGELSNFILGSVFAAVAGIIYRHKKTKTGALIGGVAGAVAMGVFSVFSNYFVVYPAYYQMMGMSEEKILGAYQLILPVVDSMIKCLIIFNMPFTIVKGLVDVAICMLIYKPLSPILKGRSVEGGIRQLG